MFNWKWNLSDIKQDKPVKVFTIFSCGGGSSMGYKRAGFEVVGNCELDPRINAVYVANHHPKHNFVMDARDFAKLKEYPDDLMHLDILDGSPPCSTFSTAGSREKGWGIEKQFAEGQKFQRLDDLFFVYLNIVEKLQPKIAVAENVTGLIKGNARGYVSEIISKFQSLGYEVQIFQLNAALMDVPQKRERIFFIANRCGFPKLKLNFNHKPIYFGEVRSDKGVPVDPNSKSAALLKHLKDSDTSLGDVFERLHGGSSYFTNSVLRDNDIAPTLTSGSTYFRACDKCKLSVSDIRNISSFPQDYNFGTADPKFICGMSVPPNMMANIASEIWRQWLSKSL